MKKREELFSLIKEISNKPLTYNELEQISVMSEKQMINKLRTKYYANKYHIKNHSK